MQAEYDPTEICHFHTVRFALLPGINTYRMRVHAWPRNPSGLDVGGCPLSCFGSWAARLKPTWFPVSLISLQPFYFLVCEERILLLCSGICTYTTAVA